MNELTKPEPSNILAVIDRAARDPNVDVAKMERLLALAESIREKEAKAEYDQALNSAQAEMRPISRDCHNPQTRSRYASYEAIDNAIRPIYTAHGFGMSFGSKASVSPDHVIVTCRLSHRAGHTECVELDMPADGKGARGNDVMTKTHATGSALSYAKRYIANLVWNLSFGESDDDGNAAGKTSKIVANWQQNPEPKPATKADVLPAQPKAATPATKQWMLDHIRPLAGAVEYAKSLGYDSLDGWPLSAVPTTKEGLTNLIVDIREFSKGKPAIEPAQPESDEMPEELAKEIVVVPRAGTKRADYMQHPDTWGSLHAAMKAGDEKARVRYWGLLREWEPQEWVGSDGQKRPPSQSDMHCREIGNRILEWHKNKGE